MTHYAGNTDSDVVLYESIDTRTGAKSYSIGYADPNYCIVLMIGVCSRAAINKRIKKGGFVVVKTVRREYTSVVPTFN
jgi:hypothetical protein